MSIVNGKGIKQIYELDDLAYCLEIHLPAFTVCTCEASLNCLE